MAGSVAVYDTTTVREAGAPSLSNRSIPFTSRAVAHGFKAMYWLSCSNNRARTISVAITSGRLGRRITIEMVTHISRSTNGHHQELGSCTNRTLCLAATARHRVSTSPSMHDVRSDAARSPTQDRKPTISTAGRYRQLCPSCAIGLVRKTS